MAEASVRYALRGAGSPSLIAAGGPALQAQSMSRITEQVCIAFLSARAGAELVPASSHAREGGRFCSSASSCAAGFCGIMSLQLERKETAARRCPVWC